MTATDFTIADTSDAGMLDVVGFDAAVPSLITEFARGIAVVCADRAGWVIIGA